MSRLIDHPHFNEAVDGAVELLANTRPGLIGRLCGPTGSGKSEAIICAAQRVFGHQAQWTDARVPIAFVRATRSSGGRFNAKQFALRTWSSVQDPDLEWLTKDEAGHSDARETRLRQRVNSALCLAMRRSKDEEGLRDAFREMAVSRGLRVLVVEDAHSMTATNKHIRPADFVQPWMSLAEEIGLILIFVGTPLLLELWDGEDEADRRSRTVFMRPYTTDTREEKLMFGKLIADIAAWYCWDNAYKPVADGAFIHLLTMGVFGQIQALFDRAQLQVKQCGRHRIEKSDIRAASMNIDKLKECAMNVAKFNIAARPTSFEDARRIHDEVSKKLESLMTACA